jgi:hypothetical protein
MNKIPSAWKTFIEDTVSDMRQVTSMIYDGSVSKGLKSGQG